MFLVVVGELREERCRVCSEGEDCLQGVETAASLRRLRGEQLQRTHPVDRPVGRLVATQDVHGVCRENLQAR